MAFRNSQQARVYAGILSAAAYARTVSTQSVTDMQDVTTLADTAKAFIPGQDTSTFSIDGPLDDSAATNGQFDALATQKASTTPTPITFLPLGTDGHAWLIDGVHTELDTTASQSGTVDWSLASQTTGVSDMAGVVLEDDTVVTVTTDGTANNNGGASAAGGVFHLHVTAYTGLTSDTITIEGSTTGAFAGEETTVASFVAATGVTSERVVVAGTVKQYLRVVDTVVGVGSATRFVAVARR